VRAQRSNRTKGMGVSNSAMTIGATQSMKSLPEKPGKAAVAQPAQQTMQ